MRLTTTLACITGLIAGGFSFAQEFLPLDDEPATEVPATDAVEPVLAPVEETTRDGNEDPQDDVFASQVIGPSDALLEATVESERRPNVRPNVRPAPDYDDTPRSESTPVQIENRPRNNARLKPMVVEQRHPDGSVERHTRIDSNIMPSTDPLDDTAAYELNRNSNSRRTRPESIDAAAEQEVRRLTETLRRVPAEQRAEVSRQLEAALQKLFDVRTQMRETQIADLEQRIRTLRSQLQKRVQMKPQIIDLRLQTLNNEANGLTF